MKRDQLIASVLFCAAIVLRLALAVPGCSEPELLMRPDSATYLAPAYSLLNDGIYGSGGTFTALRVPLYPFLLTPWLWLDGGIAGCFSILANILFSSAAVPILYFACREWGLPEKYSLIGTMIYLITPTPLAIAPMFLSDGLFGTFAAGELYFLVKLARKREPRQLYFAALTGGFAVLVRPLNLLWILPCLFAAFFLLQGKWFYKLRVCGIAAVLFALIFTPWILRNHARGFGWRIDTVSADSLKHNAAVVESRVTGKPAQGFRDQYENHFRTLFAKDPEHFSTEESRLSYQEKYLGVILKKYPLEYLKGFFHPVNYVPDVPSFLENLGLSRSGQGTWDVIINHGIFAGIRHYFGGKYHYLAILFPLCLVLAAGYLAAASGFFILLWKKKWILPLLFLPLGFYYMVVTGPVAYPRFSLPLLPYLSLLAGAGLHLFFCREEKNDEIITSERND